MNIRTQKANPLQLAEALKAMPAALNDMGYSELREAQKSPINSILLGLDTFVVLPTGGGKSLLAALPTKLLKCKTVIFSPLIALMRDQVQSLNSKGLRTAAVNGNNTEGQNSIIIQNWIQGTLDILYVAPERIQNPQFQYAMQTVKPDFVVMDEAHVASQWSAAFRPAYKRCGEFVREMNPKLVVALTATATKQIIEDVKEILGTPNMVLCRNYSPRLNLKLSSSYCSDNELFEQIREKVRSIPGSIIIYHNTIKNVEKLAVYLIQSGESCTYYHGQIESQTEKDANQDEFMSGRARIIVATNAFGMGIDKPDIRGIIHAAMPSSIEAVSQETGRASRDGGEAICHMFQTDGGAFMQKWFFEMSNPDSTALWQTWQVLQRKQDENGVAAITIADLVKEIGAGNCSNGVEGAMNMLQSLGCVDRYDNDKQVAEIIVEDTQANKPTYQAVLDAIPECGVEVRRTMANNPVYEVDVDMIAKTVIKSPATVKAHITALKKAGIISYKPPFKGKLTKLLRAPTNDDYRAADVRRRDEERKFMAVRDYCNTPDHKKQEFLLNYFSLDN